MDIQPENNQEATSEPMGAAATAAPTLLPCDAAAAASAGAAIETSTPTVPDSIPVDDVVAEPMVDAGAGTEAEVLGVQPLPEAAAPIAPSAEGVASSVPIEVSTQVADEQAPVALTMADAGPSTSPRRSRSHSPPSRRSRQEAEETASDRNRDKDRDRSKPAFALDAGRVGRSVQQFVDRSALRCGSASPVAPLV